MKMLFEALPVLLFFIAYKCWGVYAATLSAMVASLAQVLWTWFRHQRFEGTQLMTLGLITVLGGATLWLKNELFIKWKPTVLYWLLALAFWLSAILTKQPLLQRIASKNIDLPTALWKRLNISWILFFVLMGGANLYVLYHFDTDTWVNFKLFGTLGLTFVFIVGQAIYMARHLNDKAPTF